MQPRVGYRLTSAADPELGTEAGFSLSEGMFVEILLYTLNETSECAAIRRRCRE